MTDIETQTQFVPTNEGLVSLRPDAAIGPVESKYQRAARADRTRETYLWALTRWRSWAEAEGLPVFPASPEDVRRYVESWADSAPSWSSIALTMTALREASRKAGVEPPASPELRESLKGIRRTLGVAPRRPAAPIRPVELAPLLACIEADDPQGLRDRALLLLGFSACLRRSELSALNVADVVEAPEGLAVTIRASKTDQDGAGVVVPVVRGDVLCPVSALATYLASRPQLRADDPVFVSRRGTRLSGQSIGRMVKRRAQLAQLATAERVSGHSLRRGLATAAAERGTPDSAIMRHGRWTSSGMVARYTSEARSWTTAPNRGLL